MKKLKIGVIDLVSKSPNSSLYARAMYANLMGIMPQVVACWAEDAGHEVTLVVYTGRENLFQELPNDSDIVFISAFSQSAQLAYAISNMFKSKGAKTVLGGPHARCYPEDARNYFDYVVGFSDKATIHEILLENETHRPYGRHMEAKLQSKIFPGVEERWKYIETTLKKAPFLKMVPILGSTGCPYTCSFCIDSTVAYQPLDFDVIRSDLKFLLTKFKRPLVVWHDPNFGIRFNDFMDLIEDAVPTNSIDFIAESSLSILKEDNLKRLKKNGFHAMLPGVESWFDLGGKSKTGVTQGFEKMEKVSEHINQILSYIPYVQANFVFGLDTDFGSEPFDVTKAFIDKSPGAFPGYSHLTAFGRAAPLNLEYQKDNRVLGFPFHFLNNHHAMNVKPLNYSWIEFYDNVISVSEHTWSKKAIYRRWMSNKRFKIKSLNLIRAVSQEGFGRIRYFKKIRQFLKDDHQFRDYFEGESDVLPQFYVDWIKKDLGPFAEWLPEGAIYHDQNAYLKAEQKKVEILVD